MGILETRGMYPQKGFCKRTMTSPRANEPSFFTMEGEAKKGKVSSQKGRAGKTAKGKTDDLSLEETVRRWTGVGEWKEGGRSENRR